MSTTLVLGQGAAPARLDLIVRPGDPVDYLLPAYDALGALVDFSGGGWDLDASAFAPGGVQPVLSLTLNGTPQGLVLQASRTETAAWPVALPLYSPLRVTVTHASGDPIFRTRGWLAFLR